MQPKHFYMVKRDGKLPTLLCLYPDEENRGAYKYSIDYEHIVWLHAPELDDILIHREFFPEFVEVSEDEANEIERTLQAEHERIEEEKNVIHVKHEQRCVDGDTVEVDVFSKGKERLCFREKELEKLLGQLANADHMIIQGIHYSQFDIWGYEKQYDITDKNDISDACDMPLKIVGCFMDEELKYIFRYRSRKEKVEIARYRKELEIDLQSVFEDDP